ncbi:MAG: hypothetical protein BGO67_02060 [Alphaproteobacteria bacterium 41-28]|nr:MAG: hypothetical protein BGO67_02060 [Alphaproteobacteria bacterium 41-28]
MKKIRKISTALVIIFGLLILFESACFIGSGGILNELDLALVEIENLEKKSLLNNSQKNISESTEFYLSQYHNSSELKQHIREYEKSLHYREIYFCIFIALFFLSLILRIYFRKRKDVQKGSFP